MKLQSLRERLGTLLVVALTALAGSASTASAATPTRFTIVDSSPTSWVARGYDNYTVDPDVGWNFTASGGGSTVRIFASGSPLPGTSVDYWDITFDAPDNSPLTPGVYSNFQRYPFNDPGRPGVSFSSTGRLDNMAAGTFRVWEITYGLSNQIASFAADFTHYGETNINNYAIAQVRFNSFAPEPASLAALAASSLLLLRRR